MKTTTIRSVSMTLALACAATGALAQGAASYPDKPMRMVIPFPPGGTLDKVGRMLALKLGEQFGHNVVVDNRPGGNGVIGGDIVAKAPGDGYTLLFNASTFVTAPMTMKTVPYKVQTDFAPIAWVASAPCFSPLMSMSPPAFFSTNSAAIAKTTNPSASFHMISLPQSAA